MIIIIIIIIYIYIYIYIYICIHVCVYIYTYNLPPLIKPPLIKKTLGGKQFFYYQFRRRHDYPLINDDFWFDLHPS